MEDSMMSIPIFWRLTLGYLVILCLSVGVSSYTIVQLGGLGGTARTVLDTDNHLIAYEENLTDAFLSEVRYGGRFIITHARALYDQSRQFKNDFARYMSETKSLAASPEATARLSRIEELHSRYDDLFDQEVRYIKVAQPYAESRYQQEKEKILESALTDLGRLKGQLQQNLKDKLETMGRAANTARAIAAATTLILLGLGVALSFVISKSITLPLIELKRRMTEETAQDSDSFSEFSRIPELRELSDALAEAKRKLGEAAEMNAIFVRDVTEQFATPLISLRKRLSYLNEELTEKVTAEQRTTFAILAEETERLIQCCGTLRLPPRVQSEAKKHPGHTEGRGSQQPAPREILQWKSLNAFSTRVRCAVKSIAKQGQDPAAGSWSTFFQSIKTLAYGKVKKQ
jgi:CHASE3 domain sensor protein